MRTVLELDSVNTEGICGCIPIATRLSMRVDEGWKVFSGEFVFIYILLVKYAAKL